MLRSTTAAAFFALATTACVQLTISTSRVAALFHAVDQLSRWSPFTHEQ